ncbi:adenosine kinase [Cereibacter azotoformans]|uniref:Sugar/nucleoside kinase (Ribokinase family) n=1 Tax=Cereibacter azotoformans TaxID=43057 RepID=A0A2T5KEH9_9RHOB|nr:adenosine kinase [Cereibacter azotoformans]AXQ92475.1 adenosine kinase [Cereibacter sphaeroides]MBO4169951.1 adenosine kinase [Cereibacter azotoformans]PTR20787.1 sugar/nucleoside kinase (ribokinase family) [Cereibacter azotoformans]UIJ30750.1 adenosine kinase [Cereibacter azotoformans]
MKTFQVVGIGNAMVDVLSHCDDGFLDANGVGKGIMQLIDMDRAVELYGRIGPAQEISGGSAANTIAGIAHLGGRTAYVGKVCDDQLGAIFAHDLRAQGAVYETPMAPKGGAQETGRCIVLVTPDGERSMNTYLGWSEFLTADDIDEAQVAASEWIYLEGYRFDGPDSHRAFAKAIAAAKGAGGRVSVTLSDPFCVERHRDAFRRMIREDVDLLFANRAELLSMYQTEDFGAALKAAAAEVAIVACTESEKGAHVLAEGQHWHVPAIPTKIVDATGAGDLFAGAFLWGITNGHGHEAAGRMGCIAASEVISHIGARAEADLKALFKRHGAI